jgi:hypothetical protein
MNIRRDLVRAWIVANILWLLICALGWYVWTSADRAIWVAAYCSPDPDRCLDIAQRIDHASVIFAGIALFFAIASFVLCLWIQRDFRSN